MLATVRATVLENKFIPHVPHPKQAVFLGLTCREAFYGGAAGGGKSDALLMAALQYVHVPKYAALILRRSFKDLNQADALIPRSKEWLTDKAKWHGGDHQWTFPSGATIKFGYLDHDDHVYQYQGAAYQFVGYDELTQFPEQRYRYLHSRLRRLAGVNVPVRMRSASNPGGVGHDWVKKRFIKEPENRVFIPAILDDNPSLDRDDYIEGLQNLDPVLRAQLLAGDWDVYEGGRFKMEWFTKSRYADTGDAFHMKARREHIRKADCRWFIIIDPACSEKDTADPTTIGVWAMTPDKHLILVEMFREWLDIEKIIPRCKEIIETYYSGRSFVYVGIEASAAFMAIVREGQRASGMPTVKALTEELRLSKLGRATPAIVQCEQGRVWLPESADWLEDFESELKTFTGDDKLDPYDDQVDNLAWAAIEMHKLTDPGKKSRRPPALASGIAQQYGAGLPPMRA